MDERREVQSFLTSRRAAISPQQVGLPGGQRRRVPGLRRSEVAELAGLSVEYYARLERGDVKGATDEVLDAIVLALRLNDDERTHLHDLARAQRRRTPAAERKLRNPGGLRPGLVRTLDSISAPALIVDFRMDILAANPLAKALYVDMFPTLDATEAERINYAEFVFLSPAARVLYREWEPTADEVVATLRTAAGRHPSDERLGNLIGQLALHSDPFSRRWAAHSVRQRTFGTKKLHHRGIGSLELSYETMQVPTEADLAIMIYTAEPESPSDDALQLLPVWATNEAGIPRRGP